MNASRLVRPCIDCRQETDTFYGYGTAQDPIVCLACWIRRHPDIRCDRKVGGLRIVK